MDNKNINLPGLIAHRGYSSHFPENTLRSFQEAFLSGACFVECDVQLTKDLVPVVLHDSDLSRISGVAAYVHQINYSELRKLSAGYIDKFGSQFGSEKFPSLEEFADLLSQWAGRKAFVEIKRSSIRNFGTEIVLESILPILDKVFDQVTIISFDYDIISQLALEAEWHIGWVVEQWSENIITQANLLKPDYFFVDVDCIPPDVLQLEKFFWYWVLYEIDDPLKARKWVECGADFIETNDIKQLLQLAPFSESGCV